MAVSDADAVSTGAAPDDPSRAGDDLLGRRVLIAEDDPFIALALEEALNDLGLVVAASARGVRDAVKLAREVEIDVALLDVNLGGERIDAVAEILAKRGRPFIFATGCGRAGLPEAYRERPFVEKPFSQDELLDALRGAVQISATNG